MTQGRSLQAQVLYLWTLVKRFRLTFFMLFVLVFGGGTALFFLHARAGRPIGFSRAVAAAYFLLFAQPIIDIPDVGAIEAVAMIIALLRKSGETIFDPTGAISFEPGDQLTIQATLQAYEGLRKKHLAA